MKFNKLIAQLLASLPFLCACTSYAERHAAQWEAERSAKEQAVIEGAKSACAAYGFTTETEAFAQCAQTEANNALDRDALRDSAQRSRSTISTTHCVRTTLGATCTTQ